MFQISSEVKNTFLQLYNAVKDRETQLLRQIEVLTQHCKLNNSYEKCFKQISVVFDNELDILFSISNFGQINFNGLAYDSSFLKIEDYQHPDKDHVSLFKCVSNVDEHGKERKNFNDLKIKIDTENIISNNIEDEKISEENEVVEETKTEYNVSNVILECIEKQDPSLCLYKKSLEPDLLTEEEDNFSSCCSSPNEINKSTKYCDTINNLSQSSLDKQNCMLNSNSEPNLNCNSTSIISQDIHTREITNTSSAEDLNNASDRVKKLSMKQPVQVQQWMKQIISEPETEPGPNNVMEHSQIKIFHKNTS